MLLYSDSLSWFQLPNKTVYAPFGLFILIPASKQNSLCSIQTLYPDSSFQTKQSMLHSDSLSWFQLPSKTVFVLTAEFFSLNREAVNINFIVIGFTKPGIDAHAFTNSRRAYANHYTNSLNVMFRSLWEASITNINFVVFIFSQHVYAFPMPFRTRCKHANHYTRSS